MKLATLTLIAVIGTAAAEEKQDVCVQVDALAQSVMEARQAGVQLSRMISIAKQTGTYDLIKPLIIAAYDRPQFNGEAYQRKAVNEFKNQVYLECIKGSA